MEDGEKRKLMERVVKKERDGEEEKSNEGEKEEKKKM